MKIKVYIGIAVRLIMLCAIGMLTTLATPYMREFFGDVHKADPYGAIDKDWQWGARHYWYWWFTFLLFILSVVNFIISVVNLIKRNYDTSNW